MPTEVKIPSLGDSIVEIQIGRWLKKEGDWANRDETLVELDTDKSAVELPAPIAGKVVKLLKKSGDSAKVGDVIAILEPSEKPVAAPAPPPSSPTASASSPSPASSTAAKSAGNDTVFVMPAAQRELMQRDLKAADVKPSGPGGRLLKEDVVRHAEAQTKPPGSTPSPSPVARPIAQPVDAGERTETTTPMSLLRKRIAERLVQAQQNAALLTTFNEIDMSAAMALRKQHQDDFVKRHGVKIGFMSIFVRAVVDALKLVPQVNAEIRGNDVVHRNYCDIGVAIGGGKGLVVPIIRNAEKMNFAQIEIAIADFAKRAADNKLSMDELAGGTFTISNGGIYGSLLSTPIVNPPQSGILGMHAIQDRPIAVEGQVVVRPMMYVALTYDHRLIDGREAVTFLKRVKEVIESPLRMLLDV